MSENLDKDLDELQPSTNDKQAPQEPATDEVLDDEESTIFSAPVEHNDKRPTKSADHERLMNIIAACAAVLVLLGITVFLILKVAPRSDESPDSSLVFEDIKVIETDSNLFETVTITNQNGEFKFVKKQIVAETEDGETETTDYWGVDGVDITKLSSNTMSTKVSAAASFTAKREVDKQASDCGFDKPRVKVTVTATGKDPYTVLVGDTSPDGLGSYLMVEGGDIVYIVDDSEFSDFEFTLVDLADMSSIPATTFTADTSDNKTEDGSYAYFDSLTLSGTLFPEKITIINNPETTDSASLMPYLTTTPTERYANSESLSSIVSLFSNELAVAGCYAFEINDQTLKEFGLDNPDAVVTMTIDGETKTFKFTVQDDEYAAILYDGATMIRKVNISNATFLSLTTESFYMKNLFFHSVNDISALKFNNGENNINFGISYEEDSEGVKTYTFTADGVELETSKFQTFYANFVGIQCSDFSLSETAETACTITFVFNNNTTSKVEFYKANDTQYQYSIDGKQMGKITSSAYIRMVDEFVKVATATKE